MVIPVMMQWLLGTWFIIASDAPLWLKGDKISPTLNYTLVERNEEYKLLDETKYIKHDNHKTIAGYDQAKADDNTAFIWRGKGMLFFVTSKWQVRLQDTGGQWAVIAYSKTLFTPEGVDIMCRKPKLDEATISNIHQLMTQDSMLARHVSGLKIVGKK